MSVIVLRPPPARTGDAVRFVSPSGVLDVAGAGFRSFLTYFTTGASSSSTDPNVHFDKVSLPTTAGQYLGLAVGPDNKLYAGTTTGEIVRFLINTDGTFGPRKCSRRWSHTTGSRTELRYRAGV